MKSVLENENEPVSTTVTCWKERKQEKTQNFIWVGWEQTFFLIYSNTSKDLKGKLAIHQFADTQVGAGNKDQQKTKRYCTDCTIYYRSWIFFHSCIPQKETAAVNRRRRQEFAKISTMSFLYLKFSLAILIWLVPSLYFVEGVMTNLSL